jgi:hypothetical protein
MIVKTAGTKMSDNRVETINPPITNRHGRPKFAAIADGESRGQHAGCHVAHNVFDLDDRVVDKNAGGEGDRQQAD